ncbi:hypothetical protein, partial [Streptococcus suis]|uniref:hypothetical protein n=1 Tax=Streptococcus suis TaxID=1307 RepID=UPI001F48DDE4
CTGKSTNSQLGVFTYCLYKKYVPPNEGEAIMAVLSSLFSIPEHYPAFSIKIRLFLLYCLYKIRF